FVLDARCPVAVVREFVGGMFGGDGHAPVLERWRGNAENDREASLNPPAFSQSAKPEHLEALEERMHTLIGLLERCGVRAKGASVRRAASSYAPAADGVPRTEVRLQLNDGLSFVERVGYRY